MTLYRSDIIEDARHPKHYGELQDADVVLEAKNPTCGDELKLHVRRDASGAKIEEARFEGRGCMVAMASASRLLERIQGKTLVSVAKITEDDVLEIFAAPLTPGRISCALLPWDALRKLPNGIKRR
ncbi:MAG: hypothetical protein A2991_01355 [Candidatus Terrybacteria bacterium RIFCSPLOWO2_01_FULL_58_14]|uniref:NIF system FeS cluster assembly NifU N-terminal domain-containing protein n=2 Tax=Candidatus Terryibacteriota TaxID=1817920 RepID=A0A1G2Q0U9_9BACT|nr:MAG: hypothetical protein A2682_01745 [Candidatus Terrybacteria bacterium RIFCSPHIGHO2_01_FULL_58_15]OHA53471.1 MAG: hypothetical protein A2991_01355 [Candidatus Terrybacteria bacterium RIFCSPLOWO2_01_FULL_58_14]